MLVAPFTHRISLAAFSSLLAFLFSFISRPILQKQCPVAIIDVLWLLVLPLLLANPFTNGCHRFLLPQTVDQIIKLRLPVEILLQQKTKTVRGLETGNNNSKRFKKNVIFDYHKRLPPGILPFLRHLIPTLPRTHVVSLPSCTDESMDTWVNTKPKMITNISN